jgi:hypothetical protein
MTTRFLRWEEIWSSAFSSLRWRYAIALRTHILNSDEIDCHIDVPPIAAEYISASGIDPGVTLLTLYLHTFASEVNKKSPIKYCQGILTNTAASAYDGFLLDAPCPQVPPRCACKRPPYLGPVADPF